MTTLNSLEIQGIRSFSPDSPQVITFEKPLTLIVGHNGSGKTTIVECLKMITGGILPPNSDKGKYFVHDSRMYKYNEVKASISLDFSTFNQDHIHATRNFLITRDKNNATKVSFKAGECLVKCITASGEKSSVCIKCSDMDKAIPTMMGLSKAVIDSVVFCHQDENNWALDEMARVKARFDELLETSRYTKALAALNKARKTEDGHVQSKRAQLDILQQQMVQVANINEQIAQLQQEVDEGNHSISKLEEECQQIDAEIQKIKSAYGSSIDPINKLSVLEKELAVATAEFGKLHDSMQDIYQESLDDINKYYKEIATSIEESNKTYADLSKQVDTLFGEFNEIQKKIEQTTDNMNTNLLLNEGLKSCKEHLLQIQEELQQEMQSSSQSQGADFSIEAADEFLKELEQPSEEEEALIKELEACNAKIAQADEECNNIKAEVEASKLLVESLNEEINQLEDEMPDEDKLKTESESSNALRDSLLKTHQDTHVKLSALFSKRALLQRKIRIIEGPVGLDFVNPSEVKNALKILNLLSATDTEYITYYLDEVCKGVFNVEQVDAALEQRLQNLLDDKGGDESSKHPDPLYRDCLVAMKQLIQVITAKQKPPLCDGCGKSIQNIKLPVVKSSADTKQLGKRDDNGEEQEDKKGKNKTKSKKTNGTININEPYNALIKVVTSIRIKEYCESFEYVKDQTDKRDEIIKDLNKQLEDVNKNITESKTQIEKTSCDLEKQEKHCKELAGKLDEAALHLEKLMTLVRRKKSVCGKYGYVERKLKPLTAQSAKERKKQQELNAQVTKLEQARVVKASRVSSLIKRFKDSADRLGSIELELENHKSKFRDDPSQLNKASKETTNLLKQKKDEQSTVLQHINDQTVLLEGLKSNITYKTKHQNIRQLTDEIARLREKVGSAVDVQTISAKLETLANQYQDIKLKIANIQGTITTRTEHLNSLEQMLTSESFATTQKKFTQTCMELKAHAMAKEDLEIYGKYLEAGLHKYHQEKMQHINGILKRVWREVYVGNHIDYISIESNIDEQSNPTSTSSKAYNYRVILTTVSGVEMDMRGHCSAGERLLACLIVRIALNEAFCAKCNVLTLDEPTTNLDKENIESLQASLSKLVNECSVNFQLLLITHDEPFARKMAHCCACQAYYKVSKDNNNTSCITRIPMWDTEAKHYKNKTLNNH